MNRTTCDTLTVNATLTVISLFLNIEIVSSLKLYIEICAFLIVPDLFIVARQVTRLQFENLKLFTVSSNSLQIEGVRRLMPDKATV